MNNSREEQKPRHLRSIAILAAVWLGTLCFPSLALSQVTLEPLGVYRHGSVGRGAAEICAYDAPSCRVFVTNSEAIALDVLDISDPARPQLVRRLSLESHGGEPTSVSAHDGLVAVSVAATDRQAPGKVVLLDRQVRVLATVEVGSLPDMVTFTPDGRRLLVANEGEPNNEYTRDPEGSVSLIDISRGPENAIRTEVTTLGFGHFNGRIAELEASIRLFGPGASVSQDLEPEYIAVSSDSRTAWVSLQENNALAVLDLEAKRVTRLIGLGFKDHRREGFGFDASDKDGGIRIEPHPVFGMYQPDAIAAFNIGGAEYLILANEGDARPYSGFHEEVRVGKVRLDPSRFPNAAALQKPEQLGRLTITTTGDADGDGCFESIYAFGGRSFSVRSAQGELVYDSGDQLERQSARLSPRDFNSTNDENGSFDSRSDDKGPEPEGVAVGVLGGRTYAFLGLERIGGVTVYDVSDPRQPVFQSYCNTRVFDGDVEQGTAGDLGPEGILFLPSGESPNSRPLLVVAFEISGTTRIFQIEQQ